MSYRAKQFGSMGLVVCGFFLAGGVALAGKTRMSWPPATSIAGGGAASVDWSFVDGGRAWFHVNDAGGQVRSDQVVSNSPWRANYATETVDAGILLADGGGLGSSRRAAFECDGVVNGLPCISNPYGIVEIYGHIPPGSTSNSVCAVEIYNEVEGGSTGCSFGIGQGHTSAKLFYMMANGQMHFTDDLYLEGSSNLIKQTASSNYIELQGNGNTTNGVAIYLDNASTMGVGAKLVAFGVLNEASVWGDGAISSASSRTKGCGVLTAGTRTVTVVSGSSCVVSQATTTSNGVKGSVSGTTLTITDTTGSNTDTACWVCL